MQKYAQVRNSETEFEPVADDLLPGSGFEHEDADPEFSGAAENEDEEPRRT
jgi:hypothetical protein